MSKSVGVAGADEGLRSAVLKALMGQPCEVIGITESSIDLRVFNLGATVWAISATEAPNEADLEALTLIKAVGQLPLVVVRVETEPLAAGAPEVTLEMAALYEGQVLGIVNLSLIDGIGGSELRMFLESALHTRPDKRRGAGAILVEKVATIKGRGVVILGTVMRGSLQAGGDIEIQPGRRRAFLRAVTVNGREKEHAQSGEQVEIQLNGINREDLRPGLMIGVPGTLHASHVLDATVHWVHKPEKSKRVRVTFGGGEEIGTLFLNDRRPEEVRVRFDAPVSFVGYQRVLIRAFRPETLLCGGTVTAPKELPAEAAVARPMDKDIVSSIISLVGEDPEGMSTDEICQRLETSPQELGDVFENLRKQRKLLGFAGRWISPKGFDAGAKRLLDALRQMHVRYPRIPYHPREKVASMAGLKWNGKPLDRIVQALEEKVEADGAEIRLRDFQLELSPKQRDFLDRALLELQSEPVNTPNAHQMALKLNVPIEACEEIIRLGCETGEIVSLGDDVYYTPRQLGELQSRVAKLAGGKPFSTVQMRDLLETTRKYVIPLLEYFDEMNITVHRGDDRIMK